MGKLTILRSGMMTSIQDLGRKGYAYYAIPPSGCMDPNSARVGLLLLGRPESDPVIECTMVAPHIKFDDNTRIVLTGADFKWKVNNQSVSLNKILFINKNDVLKGFQSADKLRGYIVLDGCISAKEFLSSSSTYPNANWGGLDGDYLKKADVLEWENDKNTLIKDNLFRLHPGPEYSWLSKESRRRLFQNKFLITADSNRMGLRLKGVELNAKSYQLENSAPVLPGFLQLPPSGNPIVILQDGQTTGGYPRIGYLSLNELVRLNQMKLASMIMFNKE